MQPAIFLDRDNTLIANEGDLGDPAAVRLVDGVALGLRALRDAGFRLIVVTNQAGVARGKFNEEDVDAVHQRIAMLVDDQARKPIDAPGVPLGLIDRFYYCPYHPEASVPEYRRDHPWRKPHPGMILQAARDMGLDLSRSWMIGDQERDVQAGKAAGCRTVLFSRDADLAQRVRPTDFAATFADAVRIVLANRLPVAAGGAATTFVSASTVAGAGAAGGHATSSGSAAPQPRPMGASAAASAAQPTIGGALPGAVVDPAGVRRAVHELTEEIRADRLRRNEFRFVTMLAGLCQLLALTLGILGLLQVGNFEIFVKWLLGAALVQLLTLTLVVLDLRG